MSLKRRDVHTCIIVCLFLLLTVSHYQELLVGVPFLGKIDVLFLLGLSRHAVERFIYPLLVAYASWTLGPKYGSATWVASAVAMLPRALLISTSPRDAVIETIAALIIGGLSIAFAEVYRRYQRQQAELEETAAALSLSQEDYEELFTNASDAIWVHALDGTIIMGNKACERITGRRLGESVGQNVAQFLSPEALLLAREVKARLLEGEVIDQRYEQEITREDGTEAIVELVTRVIKVGGKPSGFQNIARDVTEERRLRDRLRVQIQKNLIAQEEERKRIARELHDDIAQSILLVSRRLDNLVSEAGRRLPPAAAGELEQLRGITDETYQSLQRYARDLRPSILDQMGLVAALSWLAEELNKDLGIIAEVKADTLPPLPSEMELVMFRIAQEALSNVRKHAEASEVSITVELDASDIKMTITDNGEGFSVPELAEDLAREGKLGLLGMEERARLVGGNLEIRSEPGKGTSVIVKAWI